MFNLDALKKAGAWAILTTFVIPGLIAVAHISIKNKEDIAVFKSDKKNSTRQLMRMESKLDSIESYLRKGE